MAKSYYAILGISSNATEDEIRSAYRRLAKEFHPDYYEGGSEIFREIQEAYAVLGNVRRRNEYEQKVSKVFIKKPFGTATYPEPEPLIPLVIPLQFPIFEPSLCKS
jgi:molecular chaperone DnaJ